MNSWIFWGNLDFTYVGSYLFSVIVIIYYSGSGFNGSFICHFSHLMKELCKRSNLVLGSGGVIFMENIKIVFTSDAYKVYFTIFQKH